MCSNHGAVPGLAVRAEAPVSVREAQAPRDFAVLGYRITRVLGRGGFGTVYAAERVSDGCPVAIKVALSERPDAAEGLVRETAALRAVGPPHVPAVYASGRVRDQGYVVLEHIAAPTLAERMVSHGRALALEDFAPIALSLMTALEAIHACGIVHRDLKPENIFIYDQGSARIIDFGLARDQSESARTSNIDTTIADDIGTAEYMSPEQCDGLLDADCRSDIYSLGCLFYELLSGAPPFWGQSADVREAQRSRRPAPLLLKFRCPPELDQVIRRCLAKDRERRWEDVATLRAALMTVLHTAMQQRAAARQASLRPVVAQSVRPVPPRLSSPRPPATREKRTMGLVFFESRAGVGGVQPLVTASGGQIVQTNGALYVAAFGHDVGDNPARVALVAAHRLLGAKIAPRLLVDVAAVSVQSRPDGSRRIFSPVFAKKDRFPSETDPLGVLLTAAASEVIPDLKAVALAERSDRFVLQLQQSASETTTFGIQFTPLVGRDAIIHTLVDSATHAVLALQPTLITVLAGPGYGRTHLASVAGHQLERQLPSAEVIRMSGQESAVRAVSQVLPDLLRRLLQLPASTPEQGAGKALLLERLGEVGEGVWAAAAHALGWIGADHPDVRRLAAAPGALRLASARAAGEALRKRAQHKPIVLILDDAHLADDPTLDALEYATLKDAAARIWVCVLARSSFESSRPTWGSRAAIAQKIELPALALNHAIDLARRLLLPAEYIPEAVLTRLAERTQGEPRLLVELVRGLKRDGLVRRAERGTGYYLAIDELDKLPDLPILQWNASREIEALPPQLAGHARLASVLGANFSNAEVEALLAILEREELPDDMQLDASIGIQRLIDSGILVRHRTGLLDFRHALLRDTIYQLVSEPQRKRLHRAAFEAYRSLAMPEAQRLPRLALHAARCGEREVAASAYLDLAQRFTRVQQYLEAEAAYGGALENLNDEDERNITAARGRGLMRSRLGRQEDALNDLRRARERAHASGARERELELMLDEATVLDWMRDMSASTAVVRAVEAMAEDLSPLLRARLTMSIARSHHRHGEAEASVRAGTEAVAQARDLGDEGYETRIISQLMVATDCANCGRLTQAERGFEELIEEAKSRGDLWHVSAALGNRAALWHGLKQLDRLFADLARVVQLSREIGEASMEYVAVYNLGESEYVLGRTAQAQEMGLRVRELAKQIFGDNNREVSISELLLARVALYDDDLVSARDYAISIRERSARASAAGEHEAELDAANELILEMIELGAAAGSLAQWESLVERVHNIETQPMEEVEVLERAAIVAASLGELDVGRRFYRRALFVSEQKPNLLSERLVRKLAGLFD